MGKRSHSLYIIVVLAILLLADYSFGQVQVPSQWLPSLLRRDYYTFMFMFSTCHHNRFKDFDPESGVLSVRFSFFADTDAVPIKFGEIGP